MSDITSASETPEAPKKAETPDTTQPKSDGEHRQAYGTAKTENLRDNGLWRILLPAFVLVCCAALVAVPLIILTPLFVGSLDPKAAANVAHFPLTWVWIVLIVLAISIASIVIRGLVKIFMTQAGNYR
jgi:hypothetical protein